MQRGAFVVVATPGDYGKPRPALVVQSDLFSDLPSLVVCPLTSTIREDAGIFRLDIQPNDANNLRQPSQVAIDKITVVAKTKVGAMIGQADDALLRQVDRALAVFLAIV